MFKKISHFIDYPTLGIVLAICIFGLVSIYSASFHDGIFSFKDVFFKQLVWMLIGLACYFLTVNYGHIKFLSFAYILYAAMLLLLVVVLIFGAERLGASRWLSIMGLTLQPSEIAKLTIILFLARFLSRFPGSCSEHAEIPLLKGFILALVCVGFPALLIFLEPDLGTAFLLFPIFLIMVFYAGVNVKYIYFLLGSGAALLPFAWHLLKGYQKARLTVFLNPNLDPLGAGYTIIQSKIAIGSGRFFGKGWLGGTQNQLNFLPERHTDFIFSVIGEEWGFVGSLIVAGLFVALIFRLLSFITDATDPRSRLLLVGIATSFFVQVVINIAMTIGLVPVVGLPLPFVSYGGTSLVISFITVGLASSVNKNRWVL